MTPNSTSDIYKTLSIAFGSIIVTLIGAFFVANRNAVSKEELPGLIQQYSPYTSDSKAIQSKLDELQIQQAQTIEQVRQIQIDTARISEKLGVSASPGVALKEHNK